MSKRAIDLSVEELSAMGAKAARLAVEKSHAAGQVVTGTIEVFEGGRAASSLAQLLPSGTVALVEKSDGHSAGKATSARPVSGRIVD